jgi:hypothetical protein
LLGLFAASESIQVEVSITTRAKELEKNSPIHVEMYLSITMHAYYISVFAPVVWSPQYYPS